MLKTVPLFDHHAPIITRHNLDSKHQSIFTKSLNLEILAVATIMEKQLEQELLSTGKTKQTVLKAIKTR